MYEDDINNINDVSSKVHTHTQQQSNSNKFINSRYENISFSVRFVTFRRIPCMGSGMSTHVPVQKRPLSKMLYIFCNNHQLNFNIDKAAKHWTNFPLFIVQTCWWFPFTEILTHPKHIFFAFFLYRRLLLSLIPFTYTKIYKQQTK